MLAMMPAGAVPAVSTRQLHHLSEARAVVLSRGVDSPTAYDTTQARDRFTHRFWIDPLRTTERHYLRDHLRDT